MGLVARYYVLGLQFAGAAITMLMGFSSPPSSDVIEDTPENQLTSLISFAGLMVLFMLDFHHVMIEAIVQSYRAMPIGTAFDPQGVLITLTDSLAQTFMIMLRLASPFVVYGLLFNVAIGMVNKLAPQIPIYFISQPYLIMGGMFLLYLGIAAMLRLFGDGFAPVMQGG
ncbi:flagellar biosynthetic protein FliR [compost metagenome]